MTAERETLENLSQAEKEELMRLVLSAFTPTVIALGLIIILLFLWSFALGILAIRENHRFTTWRAFVPF